MSGEDVAHLDHDELVDIIEDLEAEVLRLTIEIHGCGCPSPDGPLRPSRFHPYDKQGKQAMSYQPQSVWRCDRCAKEETLQRDERPSGWAKFKLNGIDEQLDGSHAPERHLCGECVDAWQNYMQAAPR